MAEGFVSFHRKMLEWEWYTDVNVRALFTHLVMMANWKSKKWRGINIKRGQFITSHNHLAKQTGLSPQQVRTSINKLKLTGELTYKSTNKYSVITINNYDAYQTANKQDNTRVTNNQQASNKQLTTTNKDNKDNKDNKGELKPNPLRLTKNQIKALSAEFIVLTKDDIKAAMKECNSYMIISSKSYDNVGLFFRGWLKRVAGDKKKETMKNLRNDKLLKEIKHIKTDKELEVNKQKIAEIRKKVFR